MLREASLDNGLVLNVSKCEVITGNKFCVLPPTLSDFIKLSSTEASLLGAPLLVGASMDNHLESHCSNLSRAVSRLKLISSHDALLILRNS